MSKYKFITFEGVEGSGKSTQSKMLADYLKSQEQEVILTREPGGTKVAEEIRNILINGSVEKLDGITETLLNFAARRNHVEELIKPEINNGKTIISDRFFDSTIAYQGYGYGINLDIIKNIQTSAIEDFAPDITFLIDIDPQITMERIKKRAENNRYEQMNMDFHKKVRDGFLKIAEKNDRIKVIDGSHSIKKIAQEIINFL